jgi:hypothetical protein
VEVSDVQKTRRIRLVQSRRIAPGPCEAIIHSNDNLPGFRRPAATGKRRPPSPALACHWFGRKGRLECRWRPENNGVVDARGHTTMGHVSGLSSKQPRGRSVTLAG